LANYFIVQPNHFIVQPNHFIFVPVDARRVVHLARTLLHLSPQFLYKWTLRRGDVSFTLELTTPACPVKVRPRHRLPVCSRDKDGKREGERERRFRVYQEAPSFCPAPRERDAFACKRRHQTFALSPVGCTSSMSKQTGTRSRPWLTEEFNRLSKDFIGRLDWCTSVNVNMTAQVANKEMPDTVEGMVWLNNHDVAFRMTGSARAENMNGPVLALRAHFQQSQRAAPGSHSCVCQAVQRRTRRMNAFVPCLVI